MSLSNHFGEGLLEHVLQEGPPEVVPSGARFAMDVYGLESTLQMEGEARSCEDTSVPSSLFLAVRPGAPSSVHCS